MPACLHCGKVQATAELRRLPFGRGFKCRDLWECRERVLATSKQAKGGPANASRLST